MTQGEHQSRGFSATSLGTSSSCTEFVPQEVWKAESGAPGSNHSPQGIRSICFQASADINRLDLAWVKGYSEASRNLKLGCLRWPSDGSLGNVTVGQEELAEVREALPSTSRDGVYFSKQKGLGCSSLVDLGLLGYLSQTGGLL